VVEPAVASVAPEAVAERRRTSRWGKLSPLYGVDVEPAVTVEIEQGHAAAHGLGELVEVAAPVVEGEDDAPAVGVVGERGHARLTVDRFPVCSRRTNRLQEVGESSTT